MKKITKIVKLQIVKEVISNLSKDNMNKVKGGDVTNASKKNGVRTCVGCVSDAC